MRVLIIDDEPLAVQGLEKTVRRVLGEDAEIFTAQHWETAVEIAGAEAPDVVFLDIEMPGMSGLELAKRLKDVRPDTDIVFVTAYPEYSLDAWRLHVSDYLLKPADEDDVREALDNLRHPPANAPADDSARLRVQCFGNFEAFGPDGRPLVFKRSGAKELFAYLVARRGAGATLAELCGVLWDGEDDIEKRKPYLRTYFATLRKTLAGVGMADAVRHTRDSYAVDTRWLDCDYYRFLEMEPVAVNSYRSEFMSQYSWAEMFIGPLEDKLQQGDT